MYWSLPFESRRYRDVAEALCPGLKGEGLKKLESQIGKLVRQWDQDNCVRHIVLTRPADAEYLPLLPEIEDQLRRRFGLRDAVVVDVTRLGEPPGNPLENAEEWHRHNDRIHQHLGMWAGRIATTLIRPGDVIGTAGGRAMYHTALSCTIPPSSAYYPKRVASLTGDLTAHMWQKGDYGRDSVLPRSLDADCIAALLKSSLGTRQPPRFLNCAITAPGKRVETKGITIALIGIGALAGEHRLLRHEGFSELDAVRTELATLRCLVDDNDPPPVGKEPFHHWVGDVCNYLFVVEEPLDAKHCLPDRTARELKKVVDRLNKQFVSTKPPMLIDISKRGVVLGVAGGRHKVAAIAHVLKQKPPWITHLVTDNCVAQHLLRTGAFGRDSSGGREMQGD
jgi:hypothetical protein